MGFIVFIFLFAAYTFTFGWVAKQTAFYAIRTGHDPWTWGGLALIFFCLPAVVLWIVNTVEAKNKVK